MDNFLLQNEASIEEKEITFLDGCSPHSVFTDEELALEITSKYRSEHGIYCNFTGRFGLASDLHVEMDIG